MLERIGIFLWLKIQEIGFGLLVGVCGIGLLIVTIAGLLAAFYIPGLIGGFLFPSALAWAMEVFKEGVAIGIHEGRMNLGLVIDVCVAGIALVIAGIFWFIVWIRANWEESGEIAARNKRRRKK